MRIFILCLIFYVGNLNAEIYQTLEPDHSVHFSDIYTTDSQSITLDDNRINVLSTLTPSASENIIENRSSLANVAISISSPKNSETFTTQENIPVVVNLQPKLEEGDSLQLLLDGQVIGTPQTSTEFLLPGNFARGTHQLQAQLIDKNHQILRSSQVITIYKHQASTALTHSKR